jgi:hypothetical protein
MRIITKTTDALQIKLFEVHQPIALSLECCLREVGGPIILIEGHVSLAKVSGIQSILHNTCKSWLASYAMESRGIFKVSLLDSDSQATSG